VEEVERYLQHVQNNPDADEFPMNNPTISKQIAVCEVAYYKIRYINPVLAEVDMDFYHSLPPVQKLLGEMTRQESLTMSLEVSDTTTTKTVTLTPTADQPKPNRTEKSTRLKASNNTTAITTKSTTAIPTPTADRPQPKNRTEKDTTSTPEINNNNNNNKTNDNPVKTDDNHIPGPFDHLLEQQKAEAKAERWEKERMEESSR